MPGDLDVLTGAPALGRRDPAPPGTGYVDVARVGSRSTVTRAFATSPLRLLNPRNHGSAAWIYTATYGGGLVDGDALQFTVHVARGATAFVSSQASTKIYRSPAGTRFDLEATVGDESLLVVAPDPVVCFAGASYVQTQQFHLVAGGALVLVDWLTSGRRATGERWMFDAFTGRILIRRQGRLVVHDALSLERSDGDLRARMDRFDVVCSIVIIGAALRADVTRILSEFADAPVPRRAGILTGASALGDEGCIVRLAGVSVEAVAHGVREHLRFIATRLGDDPWARKW